MSHPTVGIDLGGTNIKIGVLDAAGVLRARRSIETVAGHGPDHVVARMAQSTNELIAEAGIHKSDLRAIGVGAPGPMSHARGLILHAPNLPGFVNFPLRNRLAEQLGLPVVLENDANAAAFGEFAMGAGQGIRHMVMLTLGTGVGGGVIVDGRLVRGAFDNAGEIGHMIVHPGERECPCGKRGCLERYSSATSIVERVREAIQTGRRSVLENEMSAGRCFDAEAVLAAAANGDELASQVWDEACQSLAIACVNLQHLLNPERIVLAGGLTYAGDRLLDPVHRHFAAQSWKIARDAPDILLATLGADAGVIGAARLAIAD